MDLAVVLDANGNDQTRYLRGPEVAQILAEPSAGGQGSRWALTDHLGSVRVEVEYDPAARAAEVVKRVDYDAAGNVVRDTNPAVAMRFLFTGREYDPETGQYFNRARYYNPQAGRWTSEDPKGFAAGDPNVARYVTGKPANFTDPNGKEPIILIVLGPSAIGAAIYARYELDRAADKYD